jgi:DNA-binding NarL/FixJ family response regulator
MQILLIDDHPLFRDGVALLLARLGPEIKVLQAGSCDEGFGLIGVTPDIDLVMIDLKMPGMSGMDGIAVLRERHPEVPVVVMSSDDDQETVLRAIDQGAMGFIPKSSTSEVMLGALQLIFAKGIYLPPSAFLGARQQAGRADKEHNTGTASGKTLAKLGLTARQTDVLYMVLQGKPNKVICRELNLSPSTIKTHISAVLRALNVTTRTQAVIAASKLELTFNTGSAD